MVVKGFNKRGEFKGYLTDYWESGRYGTSYHLYKITQDRNKAINYSERHEAERDIERYKRAHTNFMNFEITE